MLCDLCVALIFLCGYFLPQRSGSIREEGEELQITLSILIWNCLVKIDKFEP